MTLALPIPMEACGFALNLHRIFFISSTLRLLGNLQLTPIRGVTYKKAFHTLLKLAETIKKPSLLLSFGRNYRLDKKKKDHVWASKTIRDLLLATISVLVKKRGKQKLKLRVLKVRIRLLFVQAHNTFQYFICADIKYHQRYRLLPVWFDFAGG